MAFERKPGEYTEKKSITATERPLTSGLFLLRCIDVGLSMSDLDLLDMGMVYDLIIEKGNDGEEYDRVATQADFDNF